MAKDLPLSCMNHHLKCGNSLVGARLAEIGNYPLLKAKKESRQLNLFESDPDFRAAVENAIAKSHLIASRTSTSLADVEEKKTWLVEIEEGLKGYKAICNVHTGMYFGNVIEKKDYDNLVEQQNFEFAFQVEKPNQYFHWELEFPEVFFQEVKGFSIVIGNPPWGRNHDISNMINLNLYRNIVNEDNSEFFILLGMNLLNWNGVEGQVLPDTLLNPSKNKIRKHIIEKFYLKVFCNIGPDWFSSDVRMSTILWICINQSYLNKSYDIQNLVLSDQLRRKCISGDFKLADAIQEYSQEITSSEILSQESTLIKTFVGNEDINILDKIRKSSIKLGCLTERGRGVELNKQGLVARCIHCENWNSPPRMNQDGTFKTKTCQFCGKSIVITHETNNIKYLVQENPDRIPNVHRRRYIDGDQISRYGSREYKFIDISAKGINYKPESLYKYPKILLRQAGVGIKAIFDAKGSYCPQSVYVYKVLDDYRNIGIDELAVLGVLLSRIFHYYLFKEFGEIDSAKAFVKLTHTRIADLPFPNIESSQRKELERLKKLVSTLDAGEIDGVTFNKFDWEVEGIVSRLFNINEKDIPRLVNEFSKVHENSTLLGLFPNGVRGRENKIEENWIKWLTQQGGL